MKEMGKILPDTTDSGTDTIFCGTDVVFLFITVKLF